MRLLLVGLLGLCCVRPLAAASWVYVSIAGEKRIAIYQRNETTGELTHRKNVSTSGEPGGLTTDPNNQFLFASMRSTGDLASFQIDSSTGSLTRVSQVSAGADPAFVATDRMGNYLLSAYYRAGKVEVHKIGKDGQLSERPVVSIKTDEKAHAILTDSSNRLAFVPHTGPNAIFQFRFDEKTGNLKANAIPKVKTGPKTGPRHLAFHPQLNVVYVDNEQGSSVTAFRLNRQKGRLTPLQTLSTLPKDFQERNSCAHLELSPSGRFLYAANRGHNSLAGYQVDRESGRLVGIGQTPTEAIPRSFNISPDEKFLYAAGQESGKIAAYEIHSQKGTLKRIATYTVGQKPWWVLVVDFPRKS